MAGLTRRAGAAALVVAAAVGLAACGGGSNGDAIATCKGVRLALADYARSQHAPTAQARQDDLRAAHHQIALVQSNAALANSADGSYDALMTLVQEAAVMPFRYVAPALRVTCAAVDSSTSYL